MATISCNLINMPSIQGTSPRLHKDENYPSALYNQQDREFIEVEASIEELIAHAISYGDYSITGSSVTRRNEVAWRAALIENFLEEKSKHWVLKDSFARLDSTEKAFISYVMGMTQASLIAAKLLNVTTLVHYDSVLESLGCAKANTKRPDLIGSFTPVSRMQSPTSKSHANVPQIPSARIVIEAKGTSHNGRRQTIEYAIKQLGKDASSIPTSPLPDEILSLVGKGALWTVSYSYFNAGSAAGRLWKNIMEDPPSSMELDSHWSNDEYRGALIASQLHPIVNALTVNQNNLGIETTNIPGLSTIQISRDTYVGIRDEVKAVCNRHESLFAIDSTKDRSSDAAIFSAFESELSKIMNETRPAPFEAARTYESNGYKITCLHSGIVAAVKLSN